MSDRIHNWVICFSGALQDEGKDVGMVRLWNVLRHKHSSAHTCVLHYCWDHSVHSIAELIHRLRPALGLKITVIGYSWGGMTAVNLCNELHSRNLNVDYLILNDAVYRHWYKLGWWRAYAPWSKIVVPSNVKAVYWFRQFRSRLRGHTVVRSSDKFTSLTRPIVLGVEHKYMDDQPRFQELARSIVHEALGVRE